MSAPASSGALEAVALTLRAGGRTLLDSLTQGFGPGQSWCVAGPNGAGKTTLLTVLAGLRPPEAGQALLDGAPLARWSAAALARRRAWTAQQQHDDFDASVLDIVLLARHPWRSGWGWESEADMQAGRAALGALDIAPLARRNVRTLSGGERQRVAIAAALAQDTGLLLLDEPLAHLDLRHQIGALRLLAECADNGRCVLFSCHDLNLARRFATHALLLDGRGGAVAGPARETLSSVHATRAFGHPFVLLRHDGHEALLPAEALAAAPERPAPPYHPAPPPSSYGISDDRPK
jgi:iron complex transport system ATP-binding protein